MNVGDKVQLISNFECPGQDTIPGKTDLRVCSINEHDKIATVEFDNKFLAVPIDLIKMKKKAVKKVSKKKTKEILTTSATGSKRFNKGKPEIHQVPYCAVKAIAEALMAGEEKYGKWNWTKGNHFSVPWDSAQRHMWKFMEGEDIDEDTGVHHIKLALVNLAMLLYYTENHPDMDNRHKGVSDE